MTVSAENVLCLAYFHADPESGLDGQDLVGLAPTLLGGVPGLDRFDVLAGTSRPAAFAMPEEMELKSGDSPATPYDGAVVVGGSPAAVSEILDEHLRHRLGRLHAYRVEEKVIFDKRSPHDGNAEAIKFLLSVQWFADLPASAVRRSWQVHEPLAERVHVGSDRYVQWWVHESLDEGAPAVGGIVEMGFPNEEALVKGFFDSPRGETEIVQDSAHFIAGGHPRVFVKEHRFRTDPAVK
ncbi:hypothetical protein GCM10023081_46290 [Arthrobacter ginkgonis]|uniref:EthD domain-containing protein n=1 Tax=Arthrobacter ginkgonis TaxID=1630594 RepID=A0ABP7DEZ5_9MICC